MKMHASREMESRRLRGRGIAFALAGMVVLLLPLRPAFAGAVPPPQQANLMERLAALDAQVAALETTVEEQAGQIAALTAALEAETADRAQADAALQGQVGPLEAKLAPFSTVVRSGGGYDVYLTWANLHLRNGLGATNGYPPLPWTTDEAYTQTNGLGNLIVGYGEAQTYRWDAAAEDFVAWEEADRAGSHNIVIGFNNGYASFAGLVAGRDNYVGAPYASVSGGHYNTASARYASVTAGHFNWASNDGASVSGGLFNTASGMESSVTGGTSNTASNYSASVTGGWSNTAIGDNASVSGGGANTAGGSRGSVSGGHNRSVIGQHNWAAGALFQAN